MYRPQHQFFVALNHAERAARRGDITLVERWLKVAERHMKIARQLQELSSQDEDAAVRARRPSWLR